MTTNSTNDATISEPIRDRLALPFIRLASRVVHGSRTLGAAILVINARGELLLVKNPYREGYGLPGGFCRRREDPAVTAIRELKEETGLVVTLSGQAPAVMVDPYRPHLHFLFRASVEVDTPTKGHRQPRLEISGVGWYLPDALPPLSRGTAEQLWTLGIRANFSMY